MTVSPHDEKPSISVVVPCFNTEDCLERSIGSLLQQTFRDFEVIVVDDGSTDGTPSVLQALAQHDSRVRVCRQANQGPHAARLAGIRVARADWVTFMDADDEVLPVHLQYLWSGVAPAAGVVVGGFVAVSPDGRQHHYRPDFARLSAHAAAKKLLVDHHTTGLRSCINKLYRKSLLRAELLVLPRISRGEDALLNLRAFGMAGDYEVIGLPNATYRYIAREGSLMRTMSARHVDDFFVSRNEIDTTALDTLSMDPVRQREYARRRQIAVIDFLGNVYRSHDRALIQRYEQALESRSFSLPLPWDDLVLALRWVKWHARLATGRIGRFFAWLD